MIDSNQLHTLLNSLDAPIEKGKIQPSYAYEHYLGEGIYLYLKKTIDDKPVSSPIVIHPDNKKLKTQIEAISGITCTWEARKSSSYRKFPKYNGNETKYGFDVNCVSEEAFIKLIKLISGKDLQLDTSKKRTENPLLNNKVISEGIRVVDELTVRAIRTRRGQDKFRESLLSEFNNTCCVTGSTVISVLEAAHIISHSDETNYKVTNGLLLRADIHTLFDLNLIGVDQYGVVHISDDLKLSEYDEYQGVNIASNLHQGIVENLQSRFIEYKEKNSINQNDN